MKNSFQTKSDMVYHRVREDIVSGVFAPGERLLISAVAKQYGVSEIPVREAFRVLSQEGSSRLALTAALSSARFPGRMSKISSRFVWNWKHLLQGRLSGE